MTDLFRLTNVGILTVLAVVTVAAALQLANSMATANRHIVRRWTPESVRELAVFAHLVVTLNAIALVIGRWSADLGPVAANHTARYLSGVVAIVVVLIVARLRRGDRWESVLLALALVGTLPAADGLPGWWGLILLVAGTMLMLVRAAGWLAGLARERRSRLTRQSFKAAIDQLPSALAFADMRGRTLLFGEPMRLLAVGVFGRDIRDVRRIWERLQTLRVAPDVRAESVGDGQIVCQLPNGSVWLFCLERIEADRHSYDLLTAHQITQSWDLTRRLREQVSELTARRDQLMDSVAISQESAAAAEVLRTKAHVHDVMGAQLSVVQRLIEQGASAPSDLALTLEALQAQLLASPGVSPTREMAALRKSFARIGLQIVGPDVWPGGLRSSGLVVDIVREATTNAVRHGAASRVEALGRHGASGYQLQVSDDGLGGVPELRPGSGLSMVRDRLTDLGGTLTVTGGSPFVLTVTIPDEGETP